ncbi:MAG: type II toxin-antitoxin system RelE/ParE family toxin [Planctomycetota bacterium]|nr:type II toxin-antitoxin system RelE/ParE family toxin [Planctomycetota bacterium]
MAYSISFSHRADRQLRSLRAYHRGTLLHRNTRMLAHQPQVATRNRKPLRPNDVAPWELRVGHLRIFYMVDENTRQVWILAIGVKDRARVWMEGQEARLEG